MVSGFYSRLASLAVIIMMAVAIYVHSAVSDPALFPLQPSAPIIPAAVMAIAAWIVRSGSGAWSLDLLTDASHRKSHQGDIVEQSR